MQSLSNELQKYRSAGEPLPNEAQCPQCGWFNISHPDVRRIINSKIELGSLAKNGLQLARCKCEGMALQQKHRDDIRWAEGNLANPDVDGWMAFEAFDIDAREQRELRYTCQEFANGNGPSLLVLVGGPGTGKTHMLQAIVRDVLRQGKSARYELAGRFLDRLRHTFEAQEENSLASHPSMVRELRLRSAPRGSTRGASAGMSTSTSSSSACRLWRIDSACGSTSAPPMRR